MDSWPFLREVEEGDEGRPYLMLMPPHTSDLGIGRVALERAFTQSEALYDALPAWSSAFPAASFALVEVEGDGGVSRYGGYICQGGWVRETIVASEDGDRSLLQAVGVDIGVRLDDYLIALGVVSSG